MSTVSDIMAALDKIAPPHLCMEGDPRGLLLGDPSTAVSRLAVCLDVTPPIAEEAIRHGAQMIIAHHPLIYYPAKRILATEPHPGGVIRSCIRADVAVACAHTNWDIAEGGVNDVLAGLIGLQNTRPVQITYSESLSHITVYVPRGSREALWNAMADAGAGHLTDSLYDRCGFWTQGTGTFRPLPGANPHIGTQQKIEEVAEERIECVVPTTSVPVVIAAMQQTHPYEEVAYNVLPLSNPGKQFGIGRIGTLPKAITPAELLDRTKIALGFDAVRMVGPEDRPVRTVAVGGGACAFLLHDAIKQGADALITSDTRHHELVDAEARGMLLLDAGHRQTETPGAQELANRLRAVLPDVTVEFL